MMGARGRPGGPPGGSSGNSPAQDAGSLPQVNAFTFTGYAPDMDTLVELYENLQKNFKSKSLFKQIFFDPQQINEIDRASLTNPMRGGGGGMSRMMGGRGGGMSRMMGGRGGGMSRMMGRRGGGMMQPGLPMVPQAARETVWQFTMQVIMW